MTVEPMIPLISMIRPMQATPVGWKPNGEKRGLIVFPREKRRPIMKEKVTVRVSKLLFILISLRAIKGLLISTGASDACDGGFSGCSLNIN